MARGPFKNVIVNGLIFGADTVRSADEGVYARVVHPATEADDLIQGDTDCDGDVDLSDYVTLQGAYSGSGGHVTVLKADLDGDGDADLADVLWFQAEFTGSK